MTSAEQFLNAIQSIAMRQAHVTAMIATVDSVEGENCTATLTDSDLQVTGVSLSAIEGNEKGFYIKPKVGSAIIVGSVGGDENSLYAAQYSEVDEVKITMAKTEILVTAEGVKIEKDGKNLMALLSEFITAVAAIVVVQGKGPDIAKLKQLEMDFKTLLK